MSNFLLELKKYCRERLNLTYIILFPLFLIILLIGGKISWISPFAIIIFLFHFRLLDDLSDLKHDKRVHPGRLLAKTTFLKEFNSLLLFLSLMLLYLVFSFTDKSSMKLYLPVLTIFSFYRHKAPTLLWIHFQLIKYPMLFFLLGLQNFLLLMALYAGFCAYEFYHDHSYGLTGKKLFAFWIGIMSFFIAAHVVF